MDEAADAAALAETVNDALFNRSVPKVPMDGFQNIASPGGEVITVVSFAGAPQCFLSIPFPAAKSYALKLLELIGQYETATGSTVPTIEDLSKVIMNNPKPKAGGTT